MPEFLFYFKTREEAETDIDIFISNSFSDEKAILIGKSILYRKDKKPIEVWEVKLFVLFDSSPTMTNAMLI
jgi:hypothetical protein